MMTLDPAGTVLVSIPAQGRVAALAGPGRRDRAPAVVTVAAGLDLPHGLAFRQGDLYVAETGRILRFRYDRAGLRATDPSVVVARLPSREHHWARTIVFGPDGRLYVAVGSSCNVCREQDRRRAAIVMYNPDGSGESVLATGLRSVVGIAFHPVTGRLWATVNERDWGPGGVAAPPDYVTEVSEGASYGWPACFAARGAFAPDPGVGGRPGCRGLTVPTIEIPPHSAPLGLTFHPGRSFPAGFRGSLLVAYHGSRPGLRPRAGYKVVRIVLAPGRPPRVEDFVTGWTRGDEVVGRPVDVLVARDGSVLVSDDHGGRIYRIRYAPRGTRPVVGAASSGTATVTTRSPAATVDSVVVRTNRPSTGARTRSTSSP
jgi:glucose/arabinose dehydrogenase